MIFKCLHVSYLDDYPWVLAIWNAINHANKNPHCLEIGPELRELGLHISQCNIGNSSNCYLKNKNLEHLSIVFVISSDGRRN